MVYRLLPRQPPRIAALRQSLRACRKKRKYPHARARRYRALYVQNLNKLGNLSWITQLLIDFVQIVIYAALSGKMRILHGKLKNHGVIFSQLGMGKRRTYFL
ncbi:MAG: hypothetical protein EBT90_01285 [Rhodobacteraceae bacterium]|nr:hypothetical protein [Paracoccaceae bacterium]